MKEVELKPCPFCGGEAQIIRNGVGCYQVFCDKCETRQYAYTHNTKEEAIEAWNRMV
jgi:Lar family restriction alleviation protein